MKTTTKILGALVLASQVRPAGLDAGLPEHKLKSDFIGKLPKRPVPERIKGMDYNKGTHAKTLQEFARRVAPDYRVHSNAQASNPARFQTGAIFVYGEEHTNVRLPSFHGSDKGSLLLESDDPELCLLEKYNKNAANKCVHIDTSSASDETKDQLTPLLQRRLSLGAKIIRMIAPQEIPRIKQEMNDDPAQSVWTQLAVFNRAISENFDAAYKNFDPATKEILQDYMEEYRENIQETDNIVYSNVSQRDANMATKSAEVIREMNDDDASTVIIVGDEHARPIADKLSTEFPEKAVIVAHPR